jgi:hypothetical protein
VKRHPTGADVVPHLVLKAATDTCCSAAISVFTFDVTDHGGRIVAVYPLTQIVEWTVACVTAGLVRPASTSSAGEGVWVGVGLGEWLADVGVALTVTLGAAVALTVGVLGAEGWRSQAVRASTTPTTTPTHRTVLIAHVRSRHPLTGSANQAKSDARWPTAWP